MASASRIRLQAPRARGIQLPLLWGLYRITGQPGAVLRRLTLPAPDRTGPSSPTPSAAAVDGQLASASASGPAPAPVSVPAPHQQATAGQDAYVAGRDQYNITYHSPSPPVDAAALGVLGASEGAKLLIRLSSDDEALDRARTVLTGVAPEAAAPALRIRLRREEDRAIAAAGHDQ